MEFSYCIGYAVDVFLDLKRHTGVVAIVFASRINLVGPDLGAEVDHEFLA